MKQGNRRLETVLAQSIVEFFREMCGQEPLYGTMEERRRIAKYKARVAARAREKEDA